MEYEEIEKQETIQKFRRVRQAERGHGGISEQCIEIYKYFTCCTEVDFCQWICRASAAAVRLGEGKYLSVSDQYGGDDRWFCICIVVRR